MSTVTISIAINLRAVTSSWRGLNGFFDLVEVHVVVARTGSHQQIRDRHVPLAGDFRDPHVKRLLGERGHARGERTVAGKEQDRGAERAIGPPERM